MTRLAQYLETVVRPCGVCGALAKPPLSDDPRFAGMGDEQVADILMTEFEQADPSIQRVILSYRLMCEDCIRLDRESRRLKEREWRIQQAREEAFRTGLLPMDALCCHFESSRKEFEQRNPEAWAWARQWTPKSGSGWFYGPAGTGKTHAARCILNKALDDALTVMEVSAPSFVMSANYWSSQERRESMGEVDVLLLDDVDKADWRNAMTVLWELIKVRHQHARRTLITANVEPEYMKKQWLSASNNNPSMVETMLDRLRDVKRKPMTGASVREQLHKEEQCQSSGQESSGPVESAVL